MYEAVFYKHIEAGFEAFPAENYVDYMTNVMPVPERHVFFLPKRNAAIVCEVKSMECVDVYEWSVRGYDQLPPNTTQMRVKTEDLDTVMNSLDEKGDPCPTCERILLNTIHQGGTRSE